MRIRIVAIGMLLLLTVAVTAAMQNGNDLYQQGLAKETAGDIKGAIQIFERIVRDFSSNRTLTAKALVQLGRWSDLLGEDEARKYYERVIREFADQKEAAAEARTRLDVLAKVAAPGAGPARRLVVDWADWDRKTTRLTREGRHLVRYNETERDFELVEIATRSVRRLTTDGPNPAEVLVVRGAIELSTDGRRLAAVVAKKPLTEAEPQANPRAELRVFEVGSRGMGRVLATWDVHGPPNSWLFQPFAWSPGNDRVWMWIVRNDQSAQIASVSLTGKVEVLKTLTWRDSSQPPSLSPDGKFLVYHDAPDRQTPPDLYVLATDGSREVRIEDPADDSKPMFLPDGSGIVFESNRRGARDLWFVAVTDGRVAGTPRLVWRGVGPFGSVQRFTDTGSLVFYASGSGWGTYTVPLDLTAVTGSIGPAARLVPMLGESDSGPAFSPDGRHLAHLRANAARIVIRELTGGRQWEVPFGTQLGSGYARIDWCSRGDTLIASGYIEGTGFVAYRVNLKDTAVQRLPIAPIAYFSTLCIGDGEEVIYVPSSPGNVPDSIVRRSLGSGRENTLFKGTVRGLARSRDGSRLALITLDPNGGERLITLPAVGGDVSPDLMPSGTSPGPQGSPYPQNVVWMPSGDRLLIARYDDMESLNTDQTRPLWLWEVPLTGGASRKLGLLPLPKVEGLFYGVTSFTVHPDGKRLAFQSHEGFVSQTWAIDNLAQFIKAGGGW